MSEFVVNSSESEAESEGEEEEEDKESFSFLYRPIRINLCLEFQDSENFLVDGDAMLGHIIGKDYY